MIDETDATQAADTPVPDDKADSSPAAADTSVKSEPKKEPVDDEFSEKVQKRIGKLTGRWRQAESEADYWRERAQRAERTPPPQQQQAPQQAKKLADFNYDEEAYQAHLEEVVAEKAAAKAEAKLREKQDRERSESSRREVMTKFREREARAKAEIEDYEEYAYSAPINDEVSDLVMAMDEGPRIAVYLGKNPEHAARINSLPPHLAAIELGRIDARLATEREQAKAKPVSKAPPPPPKIEASEGATRVSTTDPESDKLMSDDEWVKAERARVQRKQKRAAST